MKSKKFDIVFLCHEKDVKILKNSIRYAKKNIIGYRKIFIVSKKNYLPKRKDLSFFGERNYPFTKDDIKKYAPAGRAGWYYQQFLKLYFLNVAGEEALDNVLIVDADTMFIRKTTFFENEIPLYNVDIGHHQPYYDILEKVFGFGKQTNEYSGTTHHMLFQRKYIEEILSVRGKSKAKEFWKIIMANIDTTTESSLSEQDLYFNYMLKHHLAKVKIRKMRFMNFPHYGDSWIKLFKILGYSYLSSHEYLRQERFSALKRLIIEFLTVTGLKRLTKESLIKSNIIKRR